MKHGNIKNPSVCSQLVSEKTRDLQSHRHTKNSLFWKEARYLTKQKHLIVYVLWETKKTIKLFNQRNIDWPRTVLHRFEGFWSNFNWQITHCLVPYPITLRSRQCFWPCISLLNQCKLVVASLHLFTCTQNLMKVCFPIRMSTVTKKVAWENSWHSIMPLLVFLQNDFWGKSTEFQTDDVSYSDLGSASDWLKQMSLEAWLKIRSTIQIWVMSS